MKKISHKKFSFNRQLRHETLEAREMLAVNPLLCNPAVITAGSYADETMQYEPPVITGGELGELTLAAQNEELISFAA
ncbi:MAG: hypothetical protein FWE67_09790, partial [Planctomycetaceae bacterium]|nr:hypothetical protein [Planctomycetaceae bacterium]